MIAFIVVSLCCGPLIIGLVSLVLAGFVSSEGTGVPHGVVALCSVLVALQCAVAVGVGALYRWCFSRPAVRGAGLFAGLCATVFALAYPPVIELLANLAGAQIPLSRIGPELVQLVSALITVIGVTVIGCMTAVVVVELPLRWVQGDNSFLSDGTYRFLRSIGVGIVLVAGSAAMQERGARQLIDALRRVLG